MKRMHIWCSIAVVIMMLLSPVMASAAEANAIADMNTENLDLISSSEGITCIQDTTELSVSGYSRLLNASDASMETSSAVQVVCELFISSVYASRRNAKYDISAFTVDNSLKNDTLAYVNSLNEYHREVNALCDYNIVSDRISFNNFQIAIEGDTCTVQVEVKYFYDITGAFNETCNVNCEYYLTLKKTQDGWRVASVRTSMPSENIEGFIYHSFDAKELALANATKQALVSNTIEVDASYLGESNAVPPNAVYPLGSTEYDVNAAIAYAARYYNSVNSLFSSNSADCQNFASQCVWAGLLEGCGASGTSMTARPALTSSLVGTSATNLWCHNQATTYYSISYLNWTWDNVNGFLKMISVSNYSKEGPQGNLNSGLSKATPGDVIVFDSSGTCSVNSATYDHAMFVTRVTGSYGARTKSDIFVAAHSNSTTSAYAPLVNYEINHPASYYTTASIYSGNYRVAGADVPSEPVIQD